MNLRIKNAALSLIILNVIIFIMQATIGRGFTESFMLIPSDILTRPWIIITSMFLHGSFNHLLFNMYALLIFGPLLEQRIGSRKFLYMYIVSGIVAALGFSAFYTTPELGASGAIMGMLGVLIILMPDLQLLFFFVIPMSLRTAGIIWIVIDIIGIFLPNGIANLAHLFGMGYGLFYGMGLKKQKKRFDRKFSKKSYLDEDDIEDYLNTGRI